MSLATIDYNFIDERWMLYLKDVYTLRTFHATKLFFDIEKGIAHAEHLKKYYWTLYAWRKSNKLTLFAVKGDNVVYFTINDQKQFTVGSEPTWFNAVENADGSVAIAGRERFLSARKDTNYVLLMPHNQDWEHFYLEPTKELKLPDSVRELIVGGASLDG